MAENLKFSETRLHHEQSKKKRMLGVIKEAVEGIYKASKSKTLSDNEKRKLILSLEMNFGVSKRKAREYISTVEEWLSM
jgi:hypothetical protein